MAINFPAILLFLWIGESLMSNEDLQHKYEQLMSVLSAKERKILELCEGVEDGSQPCSRLSYPEVSRIVKMTVDEVETTYQRAFRKICEKRKEIQPYAD